MIRRTTTQSMTRSLVLHDTSRRDSDTRTGGQGGCPCQYCPVERGRRQTRKQREARTLRPSDPRTLLRWLRWWLRRRRLRLQPGLIELGHSRRSPCKHALDLFGRLLGEDDVHRHHALWSRPCSQRLWVLWSTTHAGRLVTASTCSASSCLCESMNRSRNNETCAR